MGEIPDGFTHYNYSTVYLSKDKIFIRYAVTPPDGVGSKESWRVFPISWLYLKSIAENLDGRRAP